MGFATALALALGAFVVLPWVAHRLRRSPPKERFFAPLRFVPESTSPSDVPRGVDDRVLFAVRVFIIVLLALLAAGLRTQGHGLALREHDGDASVVLVLDDSASMRAREGASSRLALAKESLVRVLDDLDGGDRVALVLSGRPARIIRGFAQDIRALRAEIDAVAESDRGTDFAGAFAAAEGLTGDGSHGVTTVVLATDGRGGKGAGVVETRLPMRVEQVPSSVEDNCAVVEARGSSGAVDATFACQEAAHRRVRWVLLDRELAAVDADLSEGTSTVHLAAAGVPPGGVVVLDGSDAIAADDSADVSEGAARMRIAVVDSVIGVDDEDRTPPALLRALEAIAPDAEVLRMAQIPVNAALDEVDVLAVENANAWSADTRMAMESAVDAGLALVVALGPASAQGALGASFEPFVDGPVQWESGDYNVTLPGSELAASLRGRARFMAPRGPSASVLSFADGQPFASESERGDGRVLLLAAPADPHLGDLALRAGFIDLLAGVVEHARRSRPRGALRAGEHMPVTAETRVVGPDGPVPIEHRGGDVFVDLALRGTYRVSVRGKERVRSVSVDPDEVLGRPTEFRSSAAPVASESVLRDRSPWVALVLALALGLEVGLRLRLRGGRSSTA